MNIFDAAFDHVIGVEGGYVDDPSDSGGATRYGITERVARANGYTGEMYKLPIETARKIAKKQYWDTLNLDSIAALSSRVALELFDTGYNMGVVAAGKFLQRALNVLNDGGTRWPDVTVDGIVGPMTLHAFAKFLQQRKDRGEVVMLRALNCQQLVRYMEIAEARPKDERCVYGWIDKRVDVAGEA